MDEFRFAKRKALVALPVMLAASLGACVGGIDRIEPPKLTLDAGNDDLDIKSVVDEIGLGGVNANFNVEQMDFIIADCRSGKWQGDKGFEKSVRERYTRMHGELRELSDRLKGEYEQAKGTPSEEARRAEWRRVEDELERLPEPEAFECKPKGGIDWSGSAEGGIAAGSLQGDRMFTDDEPPAASDKEAPGGISLGGRATNDPRDDEFSAEVLFLSGNFGGADVPTTGIGFQRAGAPGTAPEEFAGEADGQFDTWGLGAGFSLGRFRVSGSYAEGDSQTDFSIAPGGGVDTGIVYGDLSPGGSSGIATPFGLGGSLDYDFTQLRITGGYDLVDDDSPGSDVRIDAGPFASFVRIERSIFGSASGSGTSGSNLFEFSQTREQEIDDSLIELGVFADFLFGSGKLVPRIHGSAGAYRLSSQLRSRERNTSNFGPASDRDFTIDIEREKETIGFHGTAGAGLDIFLTNSIALSLGVDGEYYSDIGALFNPNSGDQVFFDGLSTDLETNAAWNWRAMAGIRAGF